MEKQSLVRNGVIRLPPGFRFHPTDEELVVQYLKRKVFSCPLPASIIPEIDVYKYEPWDLPGDSGRERYFFSIRETKYPNGNRPNRATGSGHWKATGKDKLVVASRSNQVVGMKKCLVFYRGKPPKGSRTDWVMHEYRLADVANRACVFPQRKNSTQNSMMMQMEDWVLCRIFLKKRSTKNDEEITQPCNNNPVRNLGVARTGFIDFMMQQRTDLNFLPPTTSSSSDSSDITEVSSNECVNGEISSFNSSFPSSHGREA
eukprot:TRINITY_DN13161_c0_g1_i1.p1 TRINITY_DN13161_c0_g1~~TRINITY_DN13161_c0_g1_i1.p1  ORF type:complete len:259 (-),score=57.09 TRINITY_DN13161_c0_g1_i1:297-1073(-)